MYISHEIVLIHSKTTTFTIMNYQNLRLSNSGTIVVMLALLFCFVYTPLAAQPPGLISSGMTLKIKGSGGTNGSAVAFDTKNQLYFTVIAGNPSFPLEVFDVNGNSVQQSEAGFDARGLWYEPKTGLIEGNGPGEGGWYHLVRDANGKYTGKTETIIEGDLLPEFNACGTYDAKKKVVAFYNTGGLTFYSRKKTNYSKSLTLEGVAEASENYTENCLGYTGQKNYEFVILNHVEKTLCFFNRKGKLTATSKLPADAQTDSRFMFAYANGKAWLYNTSTRAWTGYDVF